jgi:hypothetical protein
MRIDELLTRREAIEQRLAGAITAGSVDEARAIRDEHQRVQRDILLVSEEHDRFSW